MEEKLIFETNNEILLLQVCEILKQNEIPFIRRDEGAGSYLNVALGNNAGTKRIYINSKDYEKAKNILEVFYANNKNEEEMPEELKAEPETEVDKEIKKYNIMKRIIGWIPIIMTMAVLIAGFIAVAMGQ